MTTNPNPQTTHTGAYVYAVAVDSVWDDRIYDDPTRALDEARAFAAQREEEGGDWPVAVHILAKEPLHAHGDDFNRL